METSTHNPLNYINKLNDMVNYYYSPLNYLSYIKNKDNVENDVKHVYTNELLTELINYCKRDITLNFTLMQSIINTLDTNLWFRYVLLLQSSTDTNIFIRTVGIYLLKLNPCPVYYKGIGLHIKYLVELDDDIINNIKPEFMRLFSIQFKSLLKKDALKYQYSDNVTTIGNNISKIFS